MGGMKQSVLLRQVGDNRKSIYGIIPIFWTQYGAIDIDGLTWYVVGKFILLIETSQQLTIFGFFSCQSVSNLLKFLIFQADRNAQV